MSRTSKPVAWCVAIALVVMAFAGGIVAAKNVHLTIYSNFTPTSPGYPVFHQYLRMYEQLNPGITFEDLGQDHNEDKHKTMLIAGTAADIISMGNLNLMRIYGAGLLQDPPKWFADKMHRELYPAAVDGATLHGQVVLVPNEINVAGLYYNKRIMLESGLAPTPPETWDELGSMAQKMVKRNADGSYLRPGFVNPDDWSLPRLGITMLWGEGGDIVDPDGKLVIDGAPIRRVFDRVSDWYRRFFMLSSNPFMNGQAPFIWGWSYFLSNLKAGYPGSVYEDISLGLTPAGSVNRVTNQFGNAYAVPPGPNADEAWKFLDWLYFSKAGPNGMTPFGHIQLTLGKLSLNRNDVRFYAEHPDAVYYMAQIRNLEIARNYDGYFRTRGITTAGKFGGPFKSVLLGQMAPEQAIEKLVTDHRALQAEYAELRARGGK